MRYYAESETHFWHAEYDEFVVFTVGAIGEAGESERVEVSDDEEAIELMRERGAEQLRAGFVQRRPPEERFEQGRRVRDYWENQLLDDWKKLGAVESDDSKDLRASWADLFATPIEGELGQYLDWRSTHRFGFCNFGEWRIHDQDVWVPDAANGNLFEQVVVADQGNVLGTAMMQVFARWVYIGHASNGDLFFAHVDPLDLQQHEVVFYDHEDSRPRFVCADSLSSWAWLNRCYLAHEEGEAETETLEQDMVELDERVELPWHYEELEYEASFDPGYEHKSDALFLYHQFVWLDSLLRQSPLEDFDEIGSLFYQNLHSKNSFARARTLPMDAPKALYWIWRLFWFDKPELSDCLELAEDHESPMVRDCVSLVREFLDGRKDLGTITDVFELRERFIALDVDPDRAEERAKEAAAAERLANAAYYEALERADELVASGDVEAMKRALPELLHDEAITKVVAHLASTSDEDRLWARRWEFIANRSSSRNGQGHPREDEELYEVIRRQPNLLLGSLLAIPSTWDNHSWKRLALATYTLQEQMLPHIEAAAETRDRFLRAPEAAARAYAALGDEAHVERVVELVKAMGWSEGDVMASIAHETPMKAAVEALGAIGGPRAVEVLIDLAKSAPEKIRPRAIVQLGQLADPAAQDVLVATLDTEFARYATFGLGRLGTPEAKAALDAYISMNVGGLDKMAYERGMRQLASLGVGGADEVDWEIVDRLRFLIESYERDDAELHQTLAELIVHHPDSGYAEARLREYLHHEHAQVRSAAIEGLSALGHDVELRWLDRPHVDLIWENSGVEGLLEALQDPNAVLKHNVVIKAGEEGVGDALDDAVLELVDILCRFTGYTHNYVIDGHKRTYDLIEAMSDLGSPALLRRLCKMWRSPNVHYKGAEYIQHNFDNLHERMQPYVEEVEAELAAESEPADEVLSLVTKPFGTPKDWHTSRIRSVQLVGDVVVTAADDSTVRRWSRSGELLARYDAKGVRFAAEWDGRIYGISDTTATCWEPGGNIVWQQEGSFDYWVAVVGERLVCPPYDSVRVYDKTSCEELWESKALNAALRCHAVLPSGKVATAGYQEEWIAMVDPETLSGKVWRLPAKLQQYGGVWDIAAEGDELFVSRRDDSVVVLNEAGEMLRRGLFDSSLYDVAVVDGVLATFHGKSVKLFDAKDFSLQTEVLVEFAIEEFALASGPTVVVGGKNGEMAIIS